MATRTSFSKIQEFRGEQILDSGKEKSRLLWAEKNATEMLSQEKNEWATLATVVTEAVIYSLYLDYPWDKVWHSDRQFVRGLWCQAGRS